MPVDAMILGGAGLVGLQVCRRAARDLGLERMVVASLLESEARGAVKLLQAEFRGVEFIPEWGDLFVPTEWAHLPRRELLSDRARRRRLLEILFGEFEAAYQGNHLVGLIAKHRPGVIVDCVNTATGLSYQNVFDGATRVGEWLGDAGFDPKGTEDLEMFLLSQSVPQLIRHVRMLQRATTENKTRMYLKVGTTGTGGMGMNIPYTHSEDRPSQVLLAKTEAAFGHTGLLFLLARTPDAPIVKEVKPAAMIGYRAVKTVPARDKHGNDRLFEPRAVELAGELDLAEAAAGYTEKGRLVVPVVDTGENGVFTRGEFAAITALGQMEYVTPEEISRAVVQEIRGANSGRDVISALDSAVMDPSYKAGLVRQVAMSDLKLADAAGESTGKAGGPALDHPPQVPSVALGKLGPPELSKLLFEAQLLKECFLRMESVVTDEDGRPRTGVELSRALTSHLEGSTVRHVAPSIGIPILAADGRSLLRGPRINVPEVYGHGHVVALDQPDHVDRWASKGWIDLRPSNLDAWLKRMRRMLEARLELRDMGSAAATMQSYLPTEFEIGEVVAWIFNNELGGYRIK
jgi:hypothetical protein